MFQNQVHLSVKRKKEDDDITLVERDNYTCENDKTEDLVKAQVPEEFLSSITISDHDHDNKRLKHTNDRLPQAKNRESLKAKTKKMPKMESCKLKQNSKKEILSRPEVNKLLKEIEKLNTENEILVLENKCNVDSFNELKVNNEEKSLLLSQLKTEKDQYLSEEEKLKKRIKDLEKSVVELAERSEEGKKDYFDLVKEREKMAAKLYLYDGKISNFETDICDLREEKEELSGRLLDKDSRVKVLERKISVLVERNKKYLLAYKSSLAKREEENQASRRRVLQLSKDLDLRKRKIQILREEISVRDALIAERTSELTDMTSKMTSSRSSPNSPADFGRRFHDTPSGSYHLRKSHDSHSLVALDIISEVTDAVFSR